MVKEDDTGHYRYYSDYPVVYTCNFFERYHYLQTVTHKVIN
jgi:hypothetical protein